MYCELKRIGDRETYIKKLLKSPYSTFSMLNASEFISVICADEEFIFPFNKKINGLIIESLGRNLDGGLIPLETYRYYHLAYNTTLNYMLKNSLIVTMTLRKWSPIAKIEQKPKNESNIYYTKTFLYPRILILSLPFDVYLKKINKKARNRYRYFTRNKGKVERGDPVKYLKDILKINYSAPKRQGRTLPASYLNPNLLLKTIETWKKYINLGIADFFIAKLDDIIVGYSFVPHLNKHAYISRFLVHKNYMKYGVGNGMLLEIIKYLKEHNKANIVQYGYWRNISQGINHFLEQHLFRKGIEEYRIYVKGRKVLPYIIRRSVDLTNTIQNTQIRMFQNILLSSI